MKDEIPNITNQDGRIVRLEVELSNLVKAIEDLAEASVRTSKDNHIEIAALAESLIKSREPNWGIMISSAVLAMAIGGAAMSPIWFRLSALEGNGAETKRELIEHQQLPIHPVAAAEVRELIRRVENLEKR